MARRHNAEIQSCTGRKNASNKKTKEMFTLGHGDEEGSPVVANFGLS